MSYGCMLHGWSHFTEVCPQCYPTILTSNMGNEKASAMNAAMASALTTNKELHLQIKRLENDRDELERNESKMNSALSAKQDIIDYQKEEIEQLKEEITQAMCFKRGWDARNADLKKLLDLDRSADLDDVLVKMKAALKFYANYPTSDKELPHIDVECLRPERIAVLKPLNKIGETSGPKYRIGRVAREMLKPFKRE